MSLHQGRADLPYRDDYLLAGRVLYLDAMQRMYVERAGEGEPLLMVPGITGDAGELAPLRDLLRESFATACIDRRGHSRSPRGWRKSTVAAQADDLARVQDAIGWERSFVFAAGVGATVALHFAMRYPRRVRGLLLHEPWFPGLAAEAAAFADELARGEAAVQHARARRNTGPLEARCRFLMGAGFETLAASVRQRLVKNTEMHAVEALLWENALPPSPGLVDAGPGWAITSGLRTPNALPAIAERTARALGIPHLAVQGMHGAYLCKPDAYLEAVRPVLSAWRCA